MIILVVVVLIAAAAFGVWALVRSAADADRQMNKMMEEQDDRKTEREN